jgi:general secretion pathway protein N
MGMWHKWIVLALHSAGMLVAGSFVQPRAATSSMLDILANDKAGDIGTVDLGALKPIVGWNGENATLVPSGNPLWSVPLSVLTATQERPIFSASRRRPPRVVTAPPVERPSAPPPKAAEPDHPALALIGVIVGDSDAIAVFVDRTNQKIIRLRRGESHGGWALNAVERREATLAKGDWTETIRLRGIDAPVAADLPAMAAPAAGTTFSGTSVAPVIPR